MSLSDRVRANSEAAPWVVEEIIALEADNERLRAELRHCSLFIRTREKMNPDGIALFDALVAENNDE